MLHVKYNRDSLYYTSPAVEYSLGMIYVYTYPAVGYSLGQQLAVVQPQNFVKGGAFQATPIVPCMHDSNESCKSSSWL